MSNPPWGTSAGMREEGRGDARCELCGSTDNVKRYAVTVDGEPLRLAPLLCIDHGERMIIRTGFVLGTLDRPLSKIFRDE